MTTTKSPYGQYTHKTKIANFLRVILSTLVELVDIREEWEKDRWDVRLLSKSYGIHFNHSDTHYYIDFSGIKNIKIRIEVKEYLKQRLISKQNFSWGQARNYITVLPNCC
ncbi:hypothetical protein ACFOU2_02180 [Bacillus songklensis]|uniref:Uncharacterized protein n=1 Tax=Bacillus songklensis TaxID=1069116 RepID=A0ABV8AXT4_9BACI